MEDESGLVLYNSEEVERNMLIECREKKLNGSQTDCREYKSSESSKDCKGKTCQTSLVSPVLGFSLIVCIGGVLGGYSYGFPSPTLLDLEESYESGERVTAFPSSSIYAGIFGVSPAPPIPHQYFEWQLQQLFCQITYRPKSSLCGHTLSYLM